MGGKSSQSTQTVSIPPEVLARYNAVNARAETAASRPFQQYSTDPSAFVAPLTATQQAGIAGTNAAAGMAQPYYGAATGYTLAGGQAVNPGQLDVQQYMNPYLGTVVGNTAALLGQENQQAMSGQTGNAIQQGAFGGDRAGVAAANLSRQQNLAFGNTIGNLLQQGYGQALGTAQQQQGVDLGAQQANRQALQQTAASLAGLGAGAQTAGLQGAQAQLAAGQVQQGTEQAGKTALYNQFLQEQSFPYQQAQFLANIAEGTGALSGSTTTGTSSISDRRAKHDVHEIGRTFDGQPIYNFKYNGDDRTQIGLMAQDVEKRHPEAVGLAGGLKTVDYGKATHEAAHRGHFASGGLAGNSEGGMVHMGHMGEGYAGGGMIEPMGYGSSPFIGYDPTAAFQSLYGGLLGMGKAGEGGVGGIGIPTGATSHGELAVAKMEQPQMPSMVDQADKWASLGKNVYGLGKEAGAWGKGGGKGVAPGVSGSDVKALTPDAEKTISENPDIFAHGGLVGGMRHGYAEGGIPYSGAAQSIIPDEKPGEHKLLQADPSSMPKPSGGGISGILGGLGSLASFIPGVGGVLSKGLGAAGQISGGLGFADGGDVGDDTEEKKKTDTAVTPPAQSSPMPETHDSTPIEVKASAPPRVIEGIAGDAPKIEPLKGQTLNMAKPRTFLDGLGQAVDIGTKVAGAFMGAKDGGAIGYADGGAPSHDENALKMLLGLINKNYQTEGDGEGDTFQHNLFHPGDIDEAHSSAPPEAGLGEKIDPIEVRRGAPAAPPAPAVAPPSGGLFQKIMHGEGTDKFSNPYDVVYGANPRSGLSPYANPEGRLSSMPIGAVQDFQRRLIGATRGKVRGLNPNEGTGAVGAYQFTRDTLANLAERLYGPDWKSIPFSPEVQDKLAAELARERNGHLEGTWAAFRGEGPAGSRLRAQAGYASGGFVGRHGYADGGVDDSGNDYGFAQGEDNSFGAPGVGVPLQGLDDTDELARRRKMPAAGQVIQGPTFGDPADAGSHVGNFPAVVPDQSLHRDLPAIPQAAEAAPEEGEHHRGFLGDILHGKFISGLGKGDADSWIPLLSGIGASMSGPYRGIVGLGQGIAAGAKTAQGMREFGRQAQETGIRQQLATTAQANVPISQQLANARTAEQLEAVRQNIRRNMAQMEAVGQGIPTNPEYTRLQGMLAETASKIRSTLGLAGGAPDANLKILGTPDFTKPYEAQNTALGLALAGEPGAAAVAENVAGAAREGRILDPNGLTPTPGYGSTVGGNQASITGAQEATAANAATARAANETWRTYKKDVIPIIQQIGEIPETGPGRNQISNIAAAVKVLVQSQGGDVSKIDANDPASVINAAGSVLGIPSLNAANPTAATRAIVRAIKAKVVQASKTARAVDAYTKKNINPATGLPDYSRGNLDALINQAIAGD